MKFLLDVCVSSHSLQTSLATLGYDVVSAYAIDPKATDERLMAIALQEDRILVTEDKDFGELIFVRKLPHGSIVRLVELSIDDQVRGMEELLERHAQDIGTSTIVTVTRGRIRIRR